MADFSVVLVYDVSRWGRFQNPDQSAHYEFMCAEAGVQVVYCAEPFDNDGSPAATLVKQIKRAMAAEYSRELSRKVSRGRRAARLQGYFVGGTAPYGYRRQVMDRDGRACERPDPTVWTKRQGIHVRLVLGPEDEVRTVKRIFDMYLRPKGTVAKIARWLNDNNIPNSSGRTWSKERVRYLLMNDVYAGRIVGRFRMAGVGSERKVLLPRDEWTVADEAVPPIVSERVFSSAQWKQARNAQPITDEMVLDDAQRIAREHGTLSARLLHEHGRWGALLYQRRFGGMQRLRVLVGVESAPQHRRLNERLKRLGALRWMGGRLYTDDEILELIKSLLDETGFLSASLIDRTLTVPSSQTCRRRFGNLGELYRRVGYQPLPHQLAAGRHSWSRPATGQDVSTGAEP